MWYEHTNLQHLAPAVLFFTLRTKADWTVVYDCRSSEALSCIQKSLSLRPSSSCWLLCLPSPVLFVVDFVVWNLMLTFIFSAYDENTAILVTLRCSRNDEATHSLKTHACTSGAEAVMTDRRRLEPNTERFCTASTGEAEKTLKTSVITNDGLDHQQEVHPSFMNIYWRSVRESKFTSSFVAFLC